MQLQTLKMEIAIAVAYEVDRINKLFDDNQYNKSNEIYNDRQMGEIMILLEKIIKSYNITDDVNKLLEYKPIDKDKIKSVPLYRNDIVNLDDAINQCYDERQTFDPSIIMPFSKIVAEIQDRADSVYYYDDPPKAYHNDLSAEILNELIPIRRICEKLNILKIVYDEAYKIYDFRNSGRSGYTRKDGKIVKIK